MLIYTQNISNRFSYIAQVLLGSNVQFTTSITEYTNATSTSKINYSNSAIHQQELWIIPHGLLQQQNIQQQNINCTQWQQLPIFFATKGNIPFDFFAASFYLITRYEEYLPFEVDMYNRYAHTNSIAYKNNFLHLPLINLWLQKIQQQFAFIQLPNNQFLYTPTYDIDIAYCYKHQPLLKNIVVFFRHFIQGNFNAVVESCGVLAKKTLDPFDVYNWLNALHKKHCLAPVYFFLLAQKKLGYDRNIAPKNKGLQQLILQHAKQYTVGIHPSYQSYNQPATLQQEINILNQLTHTQTLHSRQHYIKYTLPQTYAMLLQLGIKHEYSMGYGSINGFRASYCKPFYWYNLQQEQTTNLLVHPFCFMEANSFFEQKYNASQAAEELENYYLIVKQVNGHLITILHNHFITQQPQWLAWRNLYNNFLQKYF